MAENKGDTHWFTKAWNVVTQIGNVQTLFGLCTGFLAMFGVVRKMPISPAAWILGGAAFTGGWASVVTVVWVVRKTAPRVREWRNPHSLIIALKGGNSAVIEICHRGEKATWEVRRRILKVLDKSVNPDAVWRLCQLSMDGKYLRSPLHDGDVANLTLASFGHDQWRGGNWIVLHDAENRNGTRIPDKGVVVEISFKSIPSMKAGTLSKYVQITCSNPVREILDIKEISCD